MQSVAQWAFLEPMVEACQPKAETLPPDLRCALSTILWRHQNGAKGARSRKTQGSGGG